MLYAELERVNLITSSFFLVQFLSLILVFVEWKESENLWTRKIILARKRIDRKTHQKQRQHISRMADHLDEPPQKKAKKDPFQGPSDASSE